MIQLDLRWFVGLLASLALVVRISRWIFVRSSIGTHSNVLTSDEAQPTPASVGDSARDSLSLKIEMSPELIETFRQIESTTGDSLDEVLSKAFALYRMSVEAHKQGKRIGVFDRDRELELEVVGFDHRASS